MNERECLLDLIERIAKLGDGKQEVAVGDIRHEIGERSFGPALAIPAIIESTPIGSIPGLPTTIALLLAIVAAQIVMKRDHLWLPKFLERRQMSGRKLAKGMRALHRPARWIDKVLKHRMQWVSRNPTRRILGCAVVLLCCMIPPLELVPFATTAPMAAIALIGLGLMAKDGLVMLASAMMSSGTLYLIWMVISGFSSN